MSNTNHPSSKIAKLERAVVVTVLLAGLAVAALGVAGPLLTSGAGSTAVAAAGR